MVGRKSLNLLPAIGIWRSIVRTSMDSRGIGVVISYVLLTVYVTRAVG